MLYNYYDLIGQAMKDESKKTKQTINCIGDSVKLVPWKEESNEEHIIWSNIRKNHICQKGEGPFLLFAVYIIQTPSQKHCCVSKYIFPK